MQFMSLFAVIALYVASTIGGVITIPRATQDVFVPQIFEPNATTVWTIGRTETVVWDTSRAPVNISNGASVVLNEVKCRLAKGFDLRSGRVNVTVPDYVAPGLYTITLFGDSGDISPSFRIISAT